MPMMASRLLLSAPPRTYGYARVCVSPDSAAVLPSFTGKAVKTLLIKANPRLEDVFAKELKVNVGGREARAPKPIHVTPLYRLVERNGRITEHYLWKKAGARETPPLTVEPGEKLFFHVGFTEEIEYMVLDALQSLDMIEAYNTKWLLLEVEVDSSTELPSENPPIKLEPGEAVVVEMKTPALLLDPYKPTPYARFLPTPGILLAYNVGDLIRSTSRGKEYLEAVAAIERALNETWKAVNTVRAVKYIYDGKALPGLYGYVAYKAPTDADLEDLLLAANALSHAAVMGIGRSRANGFGHVKIKKPKKRNKQEQTPA